MSAGRVLLHVLFGAERGGCETDALTLIRGLPVVSHRVGVLGNSGPMERVWREAGAEVTILGERARGRRRAATAVQELARNRRPDGIMFWHGVVRLPQMMWALAPLGAPMAVHGGNPAHTMPRWVDWKFELLNRLYPPPAQLPTYICCSQYVADSFETSRYLRRFPRVVVPNGVELPTIAEHTPREIRADESAVVGMVARLSSIKDHATLVRALAQVRQRLPQVTLELAGAGNERGPLERLAADLGLRNSVRFLGDVADVYGRMAGWDLFAYATTEREGLGNAVAEAMMLGLPCVVTDVGPMREFVGAGDAVRLVPPADPAALAAAMCELLPDAGTRSALAAAGRRHALTRYHPAAFSRRYAEELGLSAPGDGTRDEDRPDACFASGGYGS